MKVRSLIPIFIGFYLIGSLLVACAAPPASAPQANPSATPDSQQNQAMTPIVGTAVEGGSQGQLAATDLPPSIIDGNQAITMADNGKTLTLQPGQRFVLMLGEGYDWNLNITNPAVVSQVMGLMPVRGSQGVFEAHQAGQTVLTASGDPLCRSAQPPCMMPSIVFEITIVVR